MAGNASSWALTCLRVCATNTLVFFEEAREEALKLDEYAESGRLKGPLHGVPITVKDMCACSSPPRFPSQHPYLFSFSLWGEWARY